MNESGRKKQLKKVTGYLGKGKFEDSYWLPASAEGLLGTPTAEVGLRGIAPLSNNFPISTMWMWTRLSWRGSELWKAFWGTFLPRWGIK